jgi:hypothetical protein
MRAFVWDRICTRFPFAGKWGEKMLNPTITREGNFIVIKDNVDGMPNGGDYGYGKFNNFGEYPLYVSISKDTITGVCITHAKDQNTYGVEIDTNTGKHVILYTIHPHAVDAMMIILKLLGD